MRTERSSRVVCREQWTKVGASVASWRLLDLPICSGGFPSRTCAPSGQCSPLQGRPFRTSAHESCRRITRLTRRSPPGRSPVKVRLAVNCIYMSSSQEPLRPPSHRLCAPVRLCVRVRRTYSSSPEEEGAGSSRALAVSPSPSAAVVGAEAGAGAGCNSLVLSPSSPSAPAAAPADAAPPVNRALPSATSCACRFRPRSSIAASIASRVLSVRAWMSSCEEVTPSVEMGGSTAGRRARGAAR